MSDENGSVPARAGEVNLPPWMRRMRESADRNLTPEVYDKIIQAQIAKAEKGDERAARFVFDYLGGASQLKGATFVQQTHTHYHGGLSGDALPGPRLSNRESNVPRRPLPQDRIEGPDDPPPRTADDYDLEREANARRVAAAAADSTPRPGRR